MKSESSLSRTHSVFKGIYLPILLFIATVALGTIGNFQYLSNQPGFLDESFEVVLLEAFLISLGFLIVEPGPYPDLSTATPWAAQAARLFGGFFLAYAAFLGLAYLFASNWMNPRKISFWYLIDVWFSKSKPGHITICGYGRKGRELAKDALNSGENVVVIDDDFVPSEAEELKSLGAITFEGDATRRHIIGKKAKTHLAKEIYVNCGSDKTNSRVTQKVSVWIDETNGKTRRTDCYTHLRNKRQRHFLPDQISNQKGILLHTYSTGEVTARELIQKHPVDRLDSSLNDEDVRVHVVIMGWTEITRGLLVHLLELMHYPESVERKITVLCNNSSEVRQEFLDDYPSLDKNFWENETGDFIDELFPILDFGDLPTSKTMLMSNEYKLYRSIEKEDILTVFVGDEDGFKSGSWVSTILPHLEDLERRYDMDTKIHYFNDFTEESDKNNNKKEFDITSKHVWLSSFDEFVDECTCNSVKGLERDRIARDIACFYYLLHHSNLKNESERWNWELPNHIFSEEDEVDRTLNIWSSLEPEQIEELRENVWVELPEKQRDSNRLAADHAGIKCRFAELISDIPRENNSWNDEVVQKLGKMEHRRWCAERLLAGWEPLPLEKNEQWMDSNRREVLRRQKFHRDIHPLEKVNKVAPEQEGKDRSQVRFVLSKVCSQID